MTIIAARKLLQRDNDQSTNADDVNLEDYIDYEAPITEPAEEKNDDIDDLDYEPAIDAPLIAAATDDPSLSQDYNFDYVNVGQAIRDNFASAAPDIVAKSAEQILMQTNRLPTLAQFLAFGAYLNPLLSIFSWWPFEFVGGYLYWIFVVLPATLFTTDTYRPFARDVVLPTVQRAATNMQTFIETNFR